MREGDEDHPSCTGRDKDSSDSASLFSMQLIRARIANLGPFANLTFSFAGADERPRPLTCVLGSAGTGKTSLLLGIAGTRPGYAISLSTAGNARNGAPPWSLTEWTLGDDETARPHPLRIATPGLLLERETEEQALPRRREQTLYERRAAEHGFAFVAIPGCRWFSRTPLTLSGPDRALLKHDVRVGTSFEDATRSDLARDTKQILSYAAIGAALEHGAASRADSMRRLFRAFSLSLGDLLGLVGYRFVGADPMTLEPLFEDASGTQISFSDAPTVVRHLASFVALPVRAVYAAYPDRDPREGQAVVLIDDIDLHQDAATQRLLAATLHRALPRVQWIVTTCSNTVALGCDPEDVVALRKTETNGGIELYTGPLAVVH